MLVDQKSESWPDDVKVSVVPAYSPTDMKLTRYTVNLDGSKLNVGQCCRVEFMDRIRMKNADCRATAESTE